MRNITTKDILQAQDKDEEALAKVVEENSGLIWSLVKRFLGRGYSRRRVIPSRGYTVL
ncbi:MAG: hypothetical protein FWC79_04710 [Oscillospiraceae bacterium]|nr:hypothetical protein [Oscillospiraceae bacterium]